MGDNEKREMLYFLSMSFALSPKFFLFVSLYPSSYCKGKTADYKLNQNRSFWGCGSHIEFIRFKQYHGMPRGHSLSIYLRFLSKESTSLYISWGKGNHYFSPNTAQWSFFTHYNLFLVKLKEKLAHKVCVNLERVYRIMLMPPLGIP